MELEFLTVKEAASILKLSPQHMAFLIRTGAGPKAFKLPGTRSEARVKREDLNKWIEENTLASGVGERIQQNKRRRTQAVKKV